MKYKILAIYIILIVLLISNVVSAYVVSVNSDKTISINGKKTFPQVFYWLCGTVPSASNCTDSLIKNSAYDVDILTFFTAPIPEHEKQKRWYVLGGEGGIMGYLKYSNNPYFFGYMQPDEPIATGRDMELLKSNYLSIKSSDTNHLVMAVDWKHIKGLQNIADIVINDMYPFARLQWMKDAGWTRPNAMYFYEDRLYKDSYQGNLDSFTKPVWNTMIAIGADNKAGYLAITKTELRSNIYTSITMDVKGISYFIYGGLSEMGDSTNTIFSNNPSLVQDYIDIATEIKSFNDILVLSTKDYSWQYRKGNQVQFSNNPPRWNGFQQLNYMLKQNGNILYLIVVNKDSLMVSTDITISGLSGYSTAKTLGTISAGSVPNRILPISNGKFTDSFDGYAVHIYQITPGNIVPTPTPTSTILPTPTVTNPQPGTDPLANLMSYIMSILTSLFKA